MSLEQGQISGLRRDKHQGVAWAGVRAEPGRESTESRQIREVKE